MGVKKIVLFASGSGSNVQNIIQHFADSDVCVSFVVTNKPDAQVVQRAKKYNVPVIPIDRHLFYETTFLAELFAVNEIDLIVLAGFLWLIPSYLVQHFPERMINLHPALLPKYGGKGMYGMRVHEAVCENKEPETGITIHFVNEQYDEGQVIFQAACRVDKSDTPARVAEKIHELEYQYFPGVIEKLLKTV